MFCPGRPVVRRFPSNMIDTGHPPRTIMKKPGLLSTGSIVRRIAALPKRQAQINPNGKRSGSSGVWACYASRPHAGAGRGVSPGARGACGSSRSQGQRNAFCRNGPRPIRRFISGAERPVNCAAWPRLGISTCSFFDEELTPGQPAQP